MKVPSCIFLVAYLAWSAVGGSDVAQAQTPTAPPANSSGNAESALVQKLLERIEALERREREREQADAVGREAEVKRLLDRINHLETKVQSLESGEILPEIVVEPEGKPTVESLDQQLKIAERKNELAWEAAEAKSKESPRIQAGPSGFSISSADTNFVFRMRGVFQLDSRTFFDESELLQGNDGFLIRRARPIFEATLYRDFDFAIVPDFAPNTPTLFDAYGNYRYEPWLQLRVGKFKPPIGLEQLQSDTALPFNERSVASDLVPTRDVGLQLWGDLEGGKWAYALGMFNGAGDGRISSNISFDDNKEFAGRVFGQPFRDFSQTWLKGVGIGVGGSYGLISSNVAGLPNNIGGTLPGYWTDGQQQFFAYNPLVGTVVADGQHWRIQPQASYYLGPFGLAGEYGVSYQNVLNSATLRRASLNNTGWALMGQWVLTGEPASYTGINPKNPFNPRNGGWGAWQLVGRYAQLHVDDEAFQGFSNPNTSAQSVGTWSVGINWWLNRNVRILTSFSYSLFDGGGVLNPADPNSAFPPATVTSTGNEMVLFTRIQLAF